MCIGAVEGQLVRPRAPLILNHITYLIVCKRLMCLQVVSEMRTILLSFCVLFGLIGCQTTTSINLVPTSNQEASFVEGQTAIKSTLPDSTVIVSSAFKEIENGSRIDVVVNVNNTSSESFILDTSSFQITSDSTGPLKVYSYDELVAEQKKKEAASTALAAFAGAMDMMAASYSGYQTTTGTYSGSTYGSYGGSAYTSGTYTATTYNSAAAQQAINNASNRTTANLQNIQQTSAATLQNLKSNILKKTTMEPGMWYGGITRFDAPELQKGEQRFYTLSISLGKETHTFQLTQKINKD